MITAGKDTMELDHLIFKDEAVIVTGTKELNIEIQEFLFSLGYRWNSGKDVRYTSAKGIIITKVHQRLLYTMKPQQYTDISDEVYRLIKGPNSDTYEYW